MKGHTMWIEASSSADIEARQARLYRNLGRELFQTEVSASLHCRREADRLGNVPSAEPLLAASLHAADTLRALPDLARAHGLPVSVFGGLAGAVFSTLRDAVIDRLVCSERSYRGTLLGMRHGVDVVRMLQLVALEVGNPLLATWCTSWLLVRIPLVEQASDQLEWFAAHPEIAGLTARPLWRRAHAAV
jgi:hypothetical protein